MPKGKQQAEKNAAKKAKKAEEEAAKVASAQQQGGAGAILEIAASLLMGSCLVKVLPLLPGILSAPEGAAGPTHKNGGGEPAEGEEQSEGADAPQESSPSTMAEVTVDRYDMLERRLSWCNGLGLAEPATGEDAWQAWMDLVQRKWDGGPKKQANLRMLGNVQNNLPQYLHILLMLMMLRSLLFRSFFAFLPWLYVYQTLSLMVPLEPMSRFPQVPLDKVPVKARLAATMALHVLVWFFFAWEGVVRTYIFEKLLLAGLFTYHAYAFRPADK